MYLTEAQKQFIHTHANDNIRDLALHKSVFGNMDATFLLAQIAGRQTVKTKIPSWYANDAIVYPAHLSLEQASSQATASYKASLLSEDTGRLVDLTGGLGVDFSFLSPHFQEAVYVERKEELCEIAAHNFGVLGLKNAAIKNAEGEVYLQQMPRADVIYLDPSRRDDAGRKVFRIEDCSPDVAAINNLLLEKAKKVIVKFSPMLDISLAVKTLHHVSEVHTVSVENECKELLFVLGKNENNTRYIAVNLLKNDKTESFTFNIREEQDREISYASSVGKYLYEPNASILKAGAFNSVSHKFGVKKLHRNSHLYTSEKPVPDFPGRVFEVKNVFIPNKQNLRSFLNETKKANIAVRNYPVSVAEIRRKTGLADGGDTYIFATTLAGEQKVWIVTTKHN